MKAWTPWRASTISWNALVVLLGLGLRSYHYLRNPSMWHDEAALVVNVLDKNFTELLGPLLFNEAAPPMFLWLEKAVVLLLGDATYALRLAPFLASCASLLLMMPIARRLLRQQTVPWMLLLLTCSDHLLWHSCEAKPYAVDVLVATAWIGLYCFTQSWRLVWRLALFTLLSPLLIFLVYPGCFLCGALLVALLPQVWRTRTPRCWLSYSVLVIAVLGAFALLAAGPAYAQRTPLIDQCWDDTWPQWQRPWTVPLWTVIQTFEVFRYCFEPLGQSLAVLALIGAISLWRRGERVLTTFLILPLALALLAAYLKAYPYGGYRVLVYAMPALTLLIGLGAEAVLAVLKSWERPVACKFLAACGPSRLGAGLMAILFLMPLVRTAQFTLTPWPRADCAGAAAYVLDHLRPGDEVAGNHWEYEYYFRHLGSTYTPLTSAPHRFRDRVWMVVTSIKQGDRLAILNQFREDQWRTLDRREFERTSVFLLSRMDTTQLPVNSRASFALLARSGPPRSLP